MDETVPPAASHRTDKGVGGARQLSRPCGKRRSGLAPRKPTSHATVGNIARRAVWRNGNTVVMLVCL